jgi:hypothetical protein
MRIATFLSFVLLILACSGDPQTPAPGEPTTPPAPTAPTTPAEPPPANPPTVADPPAPLPGEGSSCLGAAAARCKPGLTCFSKGSGGTCLNPPRGAVCGSTTCTADEICCGEKSPKCLLAAGYCYPDMPEPSGKLTIGERCDPTGGTPCLDNLTCTAGHCAVPATR